MTGQLYHRNCERCFTLNFDIFCFIYIHLLKNSSYIPLVILPESSDFDKSQIVEGEIVREKK